MPKFCPIPASEYYPNVRTNCLAFAFGITERNNFNLDGEKNIVEAFLEAWNRLVGGEIRQIYSVDEAKQDEYIFKVYGFTPYVERDPFMGMLVTLQDFHVVRRELDGTTWVHKPGWNEAPTTITTQEEWDELSKEFGDNFVLFAAKSEGAV